MEKRIKTVAFPHELNQHWDRLATSYFQKRDFLSYVHKYNPSNQRYYELYSNSCLIAGAVVYTLQIDILTFTSLTKYIKMQVIGLPVSISSCGIIGDPEELKYLLNEIFKVEKGLILGMNLCSSFSHERVINMRTLPSIIITRRFNSWEKYMESLRSSYRRRLNQIQKKYSGVESIDEPCSMFTNDHYVLYLEIMKRTKTKLETLNYEFFKNLPDNFRLTSHYSEGRLLCWHIICYDEKIVFFFFGGMNYQLRDRYQSFHNNLIGILKSSIYYNYSIIDFGQTAELAKTRLGGEIDEKRMFLFHRNKMMIQFIKLFRNLISYTKPPPIANVFVNNN